MFKEKDIEQFRIMGIEVKEIEEQILNFKKGFPYLEITKAATIGNGIIQLNDGLINDFIQRYHACAVDSTIIKFVPASGAASRMFKTLYEYSEKLKASKNNIEDLMNMCGEQSLNRFISELKNFAFYTDLENIVAKRSEGVKKLIETGDYATIIDTLLSGNGLNYSNLPKGLLAFHRYDDEIRTSFDEHLVEGANYAMSKDRQVNIHFTVSPEHLENFKIRLTEVQDKFEKRYKVKYNITFSLQKPSTDTIAVDMQNAPFRKSDGAILFRPGGHGALLENLNDLQGDIIFIKNIDNIAPDKIKEPTITYKKALSGILIAYRDKIFNYLKKLEIPVNYIHETLINEIFEFLQKDLCILPPQHLHSKTKEEKVVYILTKLNRPIRVCGMVKNECEPGGGPFWGKNSDGTVSLQIVESSQIDLKNPQQADFFINASHFNPVDIVCSIYDERGNKFGLRHHRDSKTGFISKKSFDGRDLKAQELPGLWNGAMADWNTIFVEVPIITFNPVKTIFDLIRKEHRAVIE